MAGSPFATRVRPGSLSLSLSLTITVSLTLTLTLTQSLTLTLTLTLTLAQVRPGSACAACSSAHGEGTCGAAAGEVAALTLRTRDQNGNCAPPASPPRVRLVATGDAAGGGAAGGGAAGGAVGVVRVSEGGMARVEGEGGRYVDAWVRG